MPYNDKLKTALDLSYLLSCAVNEQKPDHKRVAEMDLSKICNAARRHSVSVLVCSALESDGITIPDLRILKSKALRNLALYENERPNVLRKLEEHRIWYLPLKGIFLKDCYPVFGMREMNDNDFLCDDSRMDDVRSVMKGLGYTCKYYNKGNHDVYTKHPVLQFEMHRTLFDNHIDVLCDYYANVKDRLIRADNNAYEYRFSDEDFYIYMLSHEYKHFIYSGTGIRSLLDIYVYLKRYNESLNWKYIDFELDKLGLSEFERINRDLSDRLFSNKPLSNKEEEILLYIFSSGTYGTISISVNNLLSKRIVNQGSVRAKLDYCKERLFLSGENLQNIYPFFYEHKLFLPILYLYRPFKGIIKHPKLLLREIKAVINFKTNQKEKDEHS